MANSPLNLDPRVGADEASQKAHQLLYNTLVRIDDDLRVVPDLAESLEQPDPTDLRRAAAARRAVPQRPRADRRRTSSTRSAAFSIPRSAAAPAPTSCSQSVDAADRYTVAFTLKEPFGSFPINLVMGIVQDGLRRGERAQPIGTGPYKLAAFVQPTIASCSRRSSGYFGGAPTNAGLVLKVVPDDTMRGLELRKGTVDLVVNDLAPDIVWQLRARAGCRSRRRPAPTTPTSG